MHARARTHARNVILSAGPLIGGDTRPSDSLLNCLFNFNRVVCQNEDLLHDTNHTKVAGQRHSCGLLQYIHVLSLIGVLCRYISTILFCNRFDDDNISLSNHDKLFFI